MTQQESDLPTELPAPARRALVGAGYLLGRMLMNVDLQQLADEDFCYLTTTGRRSGRPHTIEIWFALEGSKLYMLSGGQDRVDWVKNVMEHPQVQVRIRDVVFRGQARIVDDAQEDALVRKIVYEKYTPRDSDDLSGWARTSLPVAVDLTL